ncbi:transposase [Methylosinus sp. Sm6]|uniref:transposase n=1 Tax=Methylosinus sp. Sm6 TaxID=2866948 RepID=UPI001C99C56A|nr:transposase [Methylosinus sp. Sm6]MBY6239723.1 transposase [Methylosinus sp. Sm6]
MLSAVILAFDASRAAAGAREGAQREAIARTLASLVEACVAGLVADAVLAGPPDSGLGVLAEEAGCGLVEAVDARSGLARALAGVRYPDVLVLRAGHAPERGFVDELRDAHEYGERTRAHVLRAAPHSLLTRLAPRLSEPVGLIAPRAAFGAAGDLAVLAKKLRAAELTTRARRTI